ncbi:Dyp-type peroxidase [Streptomyces phaeochromogenes]|uniref:Dyp-type peroxidase domain-containing protein n=1 Tax=Streptomyces phaeochromogenes TaxID=1923 RepID=UPI002E288174|nr:Dyp-type peroxidase domain-containing protein [Streptomyces phaeochromogenes]
MPSAETPAPQAGCPAGAGRRSFVKTALGTGAAGAALAGGGFALSQNGTAEAQTAPTSSAGKVPFHGTHQAGIVTPAPAAATFVSFDVIAGDRAGLADLLRTITARARFLTSGGTPADLGVGAPPSDNGILGPEVPADALTVTVGVGAALFDDRYGLAKAIPRRLTPMRTFPNDNLRAAECHGDQRSRLATATERTRVAREMHDIVGHNLSVIITLADAGSYAMDIAPERGRETLQLIGDTGRQALGELRRVLGVLREPGGGPPGGPELSPQPGIADLEALCTKVRTAGLEVVYRTSGDVDALDSGVQLTAYRIVQEALTNTLKHADTDTRVRLAIVEKDTRLTIRVQDTGPATPSGPPNEEGHGLVGMRERAALYGGTVHAGPAAGGGWSVEAVFDLTPQGGAR